MTRPILINTNAAGWFDDIQQQCESDQEKWPEAHVFALLDCAFSERCYPWIRNRRLPFRSLYDLSEKPDEALQAVSPTLIPLAVDTSCAWKDLLALADGLPMLSLIVTDESLDELARRLHPWCIVDADGQAFVFRFPDTRRLPGIIKVLTSEQHGALFGPAHAWRYRTRSAQWADLPLPDIAYQPAERVRLDADQCARLIKDSEADEIIADIHLNDPALMVGYRPSDAHDVVSSGLKRADNYGIADSDRTPWCRLLLQQPRFDQLPAALPLLASLAAKELSYADIETELSALVQG